MEYLISVALMGGGYYLSKQKSKQNMIKNNRNFENENMKPSQINIYESNRLNKVKNIEENLIKKNYKNIENFPYNNENIVPEKTVWSDNKLTEPDYKNMFLNNNENADIIISPLTGEPITKEDFKVEGMTPFFGSQSRQNTYEYANQPLLENFTGVNEHFKNKKENAPLFNPQENVSYTNGTPVMDDNVRERFNPSIKKQNELPIKQTQVGPGINRGYNSEPVGGFQQLEIRDYIMPKDTNELRTLNNPKVSYYGKVISGKKISKPGLMGKLDKHLPDTYYENSPDRYMTTVGAVKGKKQHPEILVKYQNRPETVKSYSGAAAPAQFKNPTKRPNVKISNNRIYKNSGPRNLGSNQNWALSNDWSDYGKVAISNKPNERDTTQDYNPVKNLVSLIKAIAMPLQDAVKTTKKENFIGNMRQTGNMQYSGPEKTTVYDPNDIARTTIKETNIHNNHNGNFAGPTKLTTYDPNDIAKTTIKETNIHDTRSGYMGSNMPSQLPAYDPNDVTRTTIKETNIHNNRSGTIGGNRPSQLTAYDPNDVTRTTIKETNIHNNRSGAIGGNRPSGLKAYDPNDIARTTIKETNIHDARIGNMGQNKPSQLPVYDPNDTAKTTIKETNIHDVRTGNMGQNKPSQLPVYDPNDIAKTTIKETNIHDTRTGYMGSGETRPHARDVDNIVKTTIKETLEQPDTELNIGGHQKQRVYDPDDVARTTMKETSIENRRKGNIDTVADGLGYLTNPMEAPNTNKQFTSDIEYVGGANNEQNDMGAYLVTEYDARNTNKQFTSDIDYTGIADSSNDKPMSYTDIYNASLNEKKEVVSKNRTPTKTSTKVSIGESDINMEVKKINGDNINSRQPVYTKTYNSIPQKNQCGITTEKITLNNEEIDSRLNPELLKPFKENPYTQSLTSS